MKSKTEIISLDNGYHLWSRTDGVGNKTKMIAVHGGPGNTNESFEIMSQYLEPLDIEITRYDQLGSYYSEQPDFENQPELAEKFLNIEYFVEELEEVRQKLGYQKFILVGNSWGGMVAQEYAIKYSQNLEALVIISMTSRDEDYTDALVELRNEYFTQEDNQYIENQLEAENFDDEKLQDLLGRMFTFYFGQNNAPRVEHQVPTTNEFVAEYMQGKNPFKTQGTLMGWNIENKVHNIKIPTYITFGEKDLFSKDKMQLIHKNIEGSVLSITPNGTHVHMKEYPEYFFENMTKFLNNL